MEDDLPPALRGRGNSMLKGGNTAKPPQQSPEQIREQAMREAEQRRLAGTSQPPARPAAAPPPPLPTTQQPPQAPTAVPTRPAAPQAAPTGDGLSYSIQGNDIQFVEITLKANESAIGEGANMMYYDQGIDMKVRMNAEDQDKGLMGKMMDIGKAALTGEKLFIMTFSNLSGQPKKVAFSAPFPGKVLPLELRKTGTILCQRGAFLCASKGVKISNATRGEIGAGLMDDSIKMDKIEGSGTAFVCVGGTINERTLGSGEVLHAASSSIAAMQASVRCKLKFIRNVGGGTTLTEITGPGTVWLQSLPFNLLRDTITSHMMETIAALEKKNKK